MSLNIEGIMLNQKANGETKKRIAFAKDEFKPIWWLQNRWDWTKAKYFRVENTYPGPGTLGSFLTDCIHLILQGDYFIPWSYQTYNLV